MVFFEMLLVVYKGKVIYLEILHYWYFGFIQEPVSGIVWLKFKMIASLK